MANGETRSIQKSQSQKQQKNAEKVATTQQKHEQEKRSEMGTSPFRYVQRFPLTREGGRQRGIAAGKSVELDGRIEWDYNGIGIDFSGNSNNKEQLAYAVYRQFRAKKRLLEP